MRPVIHGLCRMESLYGTELSLEDFALMNDALDAKAENELRARMATEGT